VSVAIAAFLLIGACEKKVVPIAPLETPPPPPIPTATFQVSNTHVHAGESVELEWSTKYANYVSIYPVGEVPPNGRQRVVPPGSTVYTLTALGPGGTYTSTLEVTVIGEPPAPPPVAAPPPPAPPREPEPSVERDMKDIFFAYNRYDIRPAEAGVVKADADFLAAHPNLRVIVSAHCDERGSREYNIKLATKRADTVRDELEKLGIRSNRLRIVVYGKEKPFCTEDTESCHQENRRIHFELDQ